jgi:hypothetical protein
MFGGAQLESAIDKALAGLPEGKNGELAVVADLNGVNVAVVVRAGDDWEFVGALGKEWHGELKAELYIRKTW